MTTATNIIDPNSPAGQSRAKRNVMVLSTMSAILGAQMPICITLGGLAGAMLAPSASLATLPIACQMIAGMIFALPISLLMGRFGRKFGFFIGTVGGAVGGALAALALVTGDFWLLCAGHAGAGIYQTAQGYYRFAATDTAPDSFKPKAISYVLAGGLFAAIIGAEVLIRTQDMLAPVPFAGAYAALVVLNLLGALLIPLLNLPPPDQVAAKADKAAGRPWSEILRQPAVPVAMLCAMLVYGTMTLVMTASPLAVVGCGFLSDDAANVVKWHVLAMFGPSFFTGSLITRFGAPKIMAVGLLFLMLCAAIGLAGVELENFYGAMILLGLGWNFGFIGATSLLAANHRPEERAKVQGVNDFVVLATVATAALSSGSLYAAGGWGLVVSSMAVPIAIAAAALLWGARMSTRPV